MARRTSIAACHLHREGDLEALENGAVPATLPLVTASLIPGLFEPPNPHPGLAEMQVCLPHPDGFADAQAVAIHHEQQQKISDSMTPFLGCFKESVHSGR